MAFLSSKPKPRERHPLPPSRRKWTRGASAIGSLDELQKLLDGGFYIFDRGRSAGYHPAVIMSWQFRTICQRIKTRQLFPGVRNTAIPFVWDAVWHRAVTGTVGRSCYLLTCDEIRIGSHFIELVSRDTVMKRAREMTTEYAGPTAKCVVRFDDSERET